MIKNIYFVKLLSQDTYIQEQFYTASIYSNNILFFLYYIPSSK